jgi:hypothetical protein
MEWAEGLTVAESRAAFSLLTWVVKTRKENGGSDTESLVTFVGAVSRTCILTQ